MSETMKKRTGEDLVFPEFDDNKVSTMTFTAPTNLSIKIDKLFEKLPITPYVVTVKKRGRKKKGEQIEHNKDVKPGSIVTLKCEGKLRGVELKPKKSSKRKKWFRNSITVVIILDKPVNFKICRNGTFQMTGCKTHEHAELCVKYIWQYMKDYTDVYSFTRGDSLEALFIPSMRNIDFSLGFTVDREKLNNYMHSSAEKEFHCLLETSLGYTGVNIKVPLNKDIRELQIKSLKWQNFDDTTKKYSDGKWKEEWTTYQDYLDLLTPKERSAKLNDERYNTFLVFHSGKTIYSGISADFMRDTYYYFISTIRKAYDYIEERLLDTADGIEGSGELSLEEELALVELEE
jgi:TATA-box binding protein (TBP) (component of TFIID and TFIIIB)